MKYVLIDVFNGDMFNEEFSGLEEAIDHLDGDIIKDYINDMC